MSEVSSITELIEESAALERMGQVAAALRLARRAVKRAVELDEPEAAAAARVAEARARFRLGQYEQAGVLARESLFSSDSRIQARAWLVLGNCASETHSLVEAESCYHRAATLAREGDYHWERIAALHGLAAGVYVPRGQFDLALASDTEVLNALGEDDRPDVRATALLNIALACQLAGQRARARAALDEATPLLTPDSLHEGYALCVAAALALEEADEEAAHALYDRTRHVAETTGEPYLNVTFRLGMSRMRRRSGDGAGAYQWADDALAFAVRVAYRHEEGKALVERGWASWLCGELVAAEEDLRSAMAVLGDLGASFDRARALFLLAALLHEQSSDEADAAWLQAAKAISTGGYGFLLEQELGFALTLVAAYLNSREPGLRQASAKLLVQLRRVPPQPLRVATLGRFEVWAGPTPVDDRALRQRRAGELLCMLLCAPDNTLSEDQVAEALSPERNAEAARITFHHATSSLRRALEPDLPDKFPSRYLDVEKGRVRLRLPSGSLVDCKVFERYCRQGRWEEAVATYAGELLPGYRYADWALADRERFALLYQKALAGAAQERLRRGGFHEALEACERLLALEPWHEQAVLLGMRSCLALGDRSGAVLLYRRLEKALREELNTQPSREVQAMLREVTG